MNYFATFRDPSAVHGMKRRWPCPEQADLASLIELWIGVKENRTAVERLNRVSDPELEGLSHYVTEPAAKHLARTHPAVAAKVFSRLVPPHLIRRKEQVLHEALANLEEGSKMLPVGWARRKVEELVTEIRRSITASPVSCLASKQSLQAKERGWNRPFSIGRVSNGHARLNHNGITFAMPQVFPLHRRRFAHERRRDPLHWPAACRIRCGCGEPRRQPLESTARCPDSDQPPNGRMKETLANNLRRCSDLLWG